MSAPTMDEHAATNDVAEKSNNCPYFQHHGCPYAKQETFDVNTLKQHPAFANGCPYKNADTNKLKDCPAFKDHKCPFDGSQKVDMSKVHECPAFKEGCPYAKLGEHNHDHTKLTEHTATAHIASESTKCPAFAHNNCPFDPKNPHSFDLSKASLCPAFQKSGGCPFKDVHLERIQECPAFKDGKCPFDGSKPVDLSRVKECPAFQKGCPYTHLHSLVTADTATHTVVVQVAAESRKCPIFAQNHGGCPYDPEHLRSIDMSKAKQCPKFQHDGNFECPYKKVKLERLNECPAFKDGKCPFDGAGKVDLSKLHQCPAFHAGCPYKNEDTSTSTTATSTTPAPAATATPTTTTTTTTTTPATTTPATTTPTQSHPPGDAAKCPFSHMHGKTPNPHDK